MITGFKRGLLISIIVLLMAALIISVGCEEKKEAPLPPSPATTELSSTLVPNIPLHVYLYAKQDRPTTIPATMVGAPEDIDIESLAIWGVFTEDEFVFGVGLTFTSASDAAKVHEVISPEKDSWKGLSGKIIYLVHGSGTTAESMITAISNNDFKNYDDSESLEAVATLPGDGITKLAAIGLAKPSEEIISFVTNNADPQTVKMIDLGLKLVRLKMVVAGLYSPGYIDIAEIIGAMEKDSSITNLGLGVLALVKSDLPGVAVEPIVKKFLEESDFTETNVGEVILFKRSFDAGDGESIPVLVRVEGNHIYAAVSGQESYAQTLLTSIN